MRTSLKRVLAGVVGLTTAAALPLSLATPAAAAPEPLGSATLSPTSSTNSNNPFSISLPAGAACDGDSANDNYRVGSYLVAKSVNPATLQFGPDGPEPGQLGPPQTTFAAPLFDTNGSPYAVAQTANATPPPGPGPIIGIPQFTFGVFDGSVPSFSLPAGEYNIGIACYIDGPGANPIEQYWNNVITVTSNPADPGTADISWTVGASAATPTGVTATPGDGTCSVAFTPGGSAPADVSYTATATPGGATATGASSPLNLTGLTNGTPYTISLVANNGVGNSAPATASCTPAAGEGPNVTNVAADPGAPGSGIVNVSWTAPAGAPASLTGYAVVWTGPESGSATVAAPTTTFQITGLDPGTYTVTVDAIYSDRGTAGSPVADTAAVSPSTVLLQNVDVTRPAGALVLTQVCGSNGPIVADPASPGFPNGLPARDAVNGSTVEAPTAGGTAPLVPGPAGTPDPNRPEYPYPTDDNGVPNPNYPTYCGIELGTARFVTRGAGAGQFFAADGVLNQVTVVDTRDNDAGWTVTGTMGDFSANSGTDTFSGSQLGWVPQAPQDTAAFTDSLGNTYNQTVAAGAAVAPNSPAATGLSAGKTLASAAAGSGLGTAILDARLKLLIPVTADAGNYDGTLTITAA